MARNALNIGKKGRKMNGLLEQLKGAGVHLTLYYIGCPSYNKNEHS